MSSAPNGPGNGQSTHGVASQLNKGGLCGPQTYKK